MPNHIKGVPKNSAMFQTAITPSKMALGIKVSFEILLLMGTEIFQFQLLGPEKMGFILGNPTSKSMTKSTFLWPSLPWVY